jgi:hypothetical protein
VKSQKELRFHTLSASGLIWKSGRKPAQPTTKGLLTFRQLPEKM